MCYLCLLTSHALLIQCLSIHPHKVAVNSWVQSPLWISGSFTSGRPFIRHFETGCERLEVKVPFIILRNDYKPDSLRPKYFIREPYSVLVCLHSCLPQLQPWAEQTDFVTAGRLCHWPISTRGEFVVVFFFSVYVKFWGAAKADGSHNKAVDFTV